MSKSFEKSTVKSLALALIEFGMHWIKGALIFCAEYLSFSFYSTKYILPSRFKPYQFDFFAKQ